MPICVGIKQAGVAAATPSLAGASEGVVVRVLEAGGVRRGGGPRALRCGGAARAGDRAVRAGWRGGSLARDATDVASEPALWEKLVNAEVFRDSVHSCEPKDKQHDGEHADERKRNEARAHDPVEHELPRATGKPPRPDVSRERFDRHRT